MARLMSVSFTEQQVRGRTKTVTRRKGWWTDKNGRQLVKPGDRITLCRKVMGRKKGEPLERICDVEIVSVVREHLSNVTTFPAYGASEMTREGFPGMDPARFIRDYFVDAQGLDPEDLVTRIEWKYGDHPCGHYDRVIGCGGCDPGAVEFVKDDGAPWRRVEAS